MGSSVQPARSRVAAHPNAAPRNNRIDPRAVGNLETLCRVWGYVKYHHPVFCDTLCRVDIDSALFALLPRVVHADRETRNRNLLDWVRSLGDYTPNRVDYEQSLAPLELVSTVDLTWTRDTTLLGV